MKSKKEIGTALQNARRNGGYRSAKDFAERMGYNISTYTDWEQGRHLFTYEQAYEMADVLRISLDELGGRTFNHANNPSEAELIECFNQMSPRFQNLLLENARAYADNGAAKNNQVAAS